MPSISLTLVVFPKFRKDFTSYGLFLVTELPLRRAFPFSYSHTAILKQRLSCERAHVILLRHVATLFCTVAITSWRPFMKGNPSANWRIEDSDCYEYSSLT